MEYAKDIILDLKQGQALHGNDYKKRSKTEKILRKILEHKMMTTIISLTIGFIVCDIMLISSFVNILKMI